MAINRQTIQVDDSRNGDFAHSTAQVLTNEKEFIMKTLIANRKYFVLILAAILMGFGTQGSYGQTITASVEQPLTEANLHGSVVTLTLSGGTYERSSFGIENAVMISGIEGVTVGSFGVDRVSDTEVTVELTFSGDFDTDATLTLTVRAGAIAGYSGNAFTVQLPVAALEESLVASTESPLTEANLHGSVVTLTLTGRNYEQFYWDIERALTVSGIDGVTVGTFGVDRVSDMEVTVALTFNGDFDTDATLTFTVGTGAIAGYSGNAFTVQLPVTALEESLDASTASSLTEANLHGSVVTLTLTGRNYERSKFTIGDALTISGIAGVTIPWHQPDRKSDTQITVKLEFDGTDFDTDATLTFTVDAGAIVGYNEALTVQVPVTALQESLVASTEFSLTEANLHGSIVTLTLTGRGYERSSYSVERAVTVSSIDGVTFESYNVNRVSDTEVTVELTFNDDFDTDATLTFTVDAGAIVGYNEALTAQIPVTALQESLVASTEFPLTEANLHGSVVTLTLTGRNYERSSWNIRRALTVSGIDGVTVGPLDEADRVSDMEVTVELTFNGDFDTNATLTFTVGAGAVAGYNQGFTAQVPVTAIEQSNATVSISPSQALSPAVREQLTFSLNIANGENVAGYQATVLFDDSALDYVRSANGDYLLADAFFGKPIVDYNQLGETSFGDPIWEASVTLAANTFAGAGNGDGTLATLTFKVVDFKASTLTLSQFYLVDSDGKRWETLIENAEVVEPPEPQDKVFGDIDRDGAVNIQDLLIVNARFGQREQNSADVNGDGIVNIVDLVLVASAFDAEAGAPSAHPQALGLLNVADVQDWLSQAHQLALTDPAYLRGMTMLEQFLAALIPKETALLPNYPNPFNPETWIPYRLVEDAFVTLTIYDGNGQVVRTLDVGHQIAAFYESRTKAIYWEGKNEFGEEVASGIYFYNLTADDYSATRKMLIIK